MATELELHKINQTKIWLQNMVIKVMLKIMELKIITIGNSKPSHRQIKTSVLTSYIKRRELRKKQLPKLLMLKMNQLLIRHREIRTLQPMLLKHIWPKRKSEMRREQKLMLETRSLIGKWLNERLL